MTTKPRRFARTSPISCDAMCKVCDYVSGTRIWVGRSWRPLRIEELGRWSPVQYGDKKGEEAVQAVFNVLRSRGCAPSLAGMTAILCCVAANERAI